MIADIVYARDHAIRRNAWVVIVVPSDKLDKVQSLLVSASQDHPFGGRTVSITDKARVSVVSAVDDIFIKDPFDTMFLGWGESPDVKELTRWRAASRSVLVRG